MENKHISSVWRQATSLILISAILNSEIFTICFVKISFSIPLEMGIRSYFTI